MSEQNEDYALHTMYSAHDSPRPTGDASMLSLNFEDDIDSLFDDEIGAANSNQKKLLKKRRSGSESAEIKAVQRSLHIWRGIACILAIGVMILALSLILKPKHSPLEEIPLINDTLTLNGGKPVCSKSSLQSNVNLNGLDPGVLSLSNAYNPHPLDELYPEELSAVRDFLLVNQSLALVPFERAGVRDSFIYAVELLPPKKADVTQYLDHMGPKPLRFARVIVFHGAYASPVVNEYAVGPISPMVAATKSGATTATTFLSAASASVHLWRGPIPWSMRPVAVNEYLVWEGLVANVMYTLRNLTLESYGTEWSDGGMTYTDNAPRGYGRNTRESWIWMMRNVEGEYINTLGLEMQIDHYDLDPTNWQVKNFVYNNQGPFLTADDLMWQYNNNASFVKIKIPVGEPEVKFNFAEKTEKSKNRNDRDRYRASKQAMTNEIKKEQREKIAPKLYYPEGERYQVNGSVITYMDWQFHFSQCVRSGLSLQDIRFDNERIAYEISIQDAYAGYSGRQPSQATSNYFDSGWLMGASTFELIPGVDCPEYATYLDLHVLINRGNVTKLPNSICLFEEDGTGPMFRHYTKARFAKSYNSAHGARSSRLILRTAVTVYNYDYIFDYVFHLDGTMEARMSATGYLQGGYFQQASDDNVYGQQVHAYSMGNLHDHIMGYKLDLDIAGERNSFEKMNFKVGEFPNLQWLPPSKTMKYVEREIIQGELDSKLILNPAKPTYWNIVNLEAKNKWGASRGYRVQPLATIVNILPESLEFMKSGGWTRYNMAVSVRKESEERSTESLYDMQAPDDPLVSWDSFFAGNESIVQEDIVAWVAVGMMHMPHAEDVPLTLTAGSVTGFVLKPFNYFDINPVLDLGRTQGVRVEYHPDPVASSKASDEDAASAAEKDIASQLEKLNFSKPYTKRQSKVLQMIQYQPMCTHSAVIHDSVTLKEDEQCYPETLDFSYHGSPIPWN